MNLSYAPAVPFQTYLPPRCLAAGVTLPDLHNFAN